MSSCKLAFSLGLLACLVLARTSSAQDTIRVVEGPSVSGTIKSISPTEISYERSGASDKVPVNQIVSVQFSGEPQQLRQARTNVSNGGYESALAQLGRLEADKITRPEIKQDVEYFTAISKARLALGGQGEVQDAGKLVVEFLREYPQSFHFYDCNEVLGDLLVAVKKYEEAQKYYAEVAKAPWPEYQMRANIATGRAMLLQNKPDAAIVEFDKVLAVAGNTPTGAAKTQRLNATLGKAAALARTDKAEEGVKLAQSVIKDGDPEDSNIMASAYITLGNCHRALKQNKQALFAFLHVDLLYNTSPQAHAEALANLSVLFGEDGKPERALQAKRTLQERYAASSWARAAGS